MCNGQMELDLNPEIDSKKVLHNIPVKTKVRVSANLDPRFTNSQYIQNYQKKFDESHSKRLRKHELRKKLTLG